MGLPPLDDARGALSQVEGRERRCRGVRGAKPLGSSWSQFMTHPYAPPLAGVDDMAELQAFAVPADRGTRLGAAILDSVIFMLAVYLPLMVTLFSAARMEVAPEEADQFE